MTKTLTILATLAILIPLGMCSYMWTVEDTLPPEKAWSE